MKHDAIGFGQKHDGAPDPRLPQPLQHNALWLGRRRGWRQVERGASGSAILPAKPLAPIKPVACPDLKEESGELPGRLVALARRPEAKERLLREIVRLRAVRD